MSRINPEHLTAVMGAINGSPFFRHMAMAVIELAPGRSIVAVAIGKEHMNPFGGLHGGVYASVIDTAAYWSAYCDLAESSGLVSIDLKVDFLAPVVAGRVVVKGQCLKAGRTICLAEARMYSDQGRLIGHGTSKLLVTGGQQSMDDAVRYAGAEKLPSKFRGD